MNAVLSLVLCLVALLGGGLVGFFVRKTYAEKKVKSAEERAKSILEEADKCSLHCARCHNIHHSSETEMIEDLLIEVSKRKRIDSYGELYLDWLGDGVRSQIAENAEVCKGHPTKQPRRRRSDTGNITESKPENTC